MYSILNIKREEKEKRREQFRKNFELFGAPVGIFVYIDRTMGYPQWSDVGMFIQSVLLLALENNLHTCAQESWASFQVLVNKHTCIGCRYCMMSCPYKARSFIHENLENQVPHTPRGKGCVESCNLCVHKVDNGENTTACAEACSKEGHQAILFGDINDPDSEISKQLVKYGGTAIRGDLGLNTAVRYRGI